MALRNVSTMDTEAEDTAHSVTFNISITFSNRNVSSDQRRAFGLLMRQRAKEMTVFATMIANNQAQVEMTRMSSAKGRSRIDVMHENYEDTGEE